MLCGRRLHMRLLRGLRMLLLLLLRRTGRD
jgi:hypothetical protein